MPVQADAVDSPSGPVHSFLPPGANAAAQALLNDPTLRGLRAEQLARMIHVTVADAREGIASIIGMINAVAQGSPNTALMPNASLGHAVGPFMSLDQAMSRFGSRMGPIVSSPRPLSPMAQPDFAPDREWGAGQIRLERRQVHFSGDFADEQAGSMELDYTEAGDLSANLTSAASAMLDYLKFQGCGPDATIADFQDTFNQEFAPPTPLVVDRKYGRKTRAALQHVIAAAPVSSQLAQTPAPPACTYAQPSGGGGTYVAPPTTITGTPPAHAMPVAQASMGGSMFSNPWTWAFVLGGVTLVALSRSKHPPKWVRDLGFHK